MAPSGTRVQRISLATSKHTKPPNQSTPKSPPSRRCWNSRRPLRRRWPAPAPRTWQAGQWLPKNTEGMGSTGGRNQRGANCKATGSPKKHQSYRCVLGLWGKALKKKVRHKGNMSKRPPPDSGVSPADPNAIFKSLCCSLLNGVSLQEDQKDNPLLGWILEQQTTSALEEIACF